MIATFSLAFSRSGSVAQKGASFYICVSRCHFCQNLAAFDICCSSMLSLVQFLFSFVLFYVNTDMIMKIKQKDKIELQHILRLSHYFFHFAAEFVTFHRLK